MSDVSRVDVFDAAMGAAGTAVQTWGVTQRQRRTAEYNKALADTREGYRQLLQDIEKENDYTQHQAMFDAGIAEVRKTVGDQWLSDPWVRNRYDQQWDGITQAARESAMNYSWAAERTALQVEMFDQIKGFYQSSLENAHANTRALINEYFEAGIIDPRVEQQAWEYYREQGAHALKVRVDAAVEVRNSEQVEQLFDAAVAGSIIEDPQLAADMKTAALYEIKVGTAEDIALTQYREFGEDAAIAWLTNPDNATMAELELEDQARVTRFLREQIGFVRSEEELAARKIDQQFMDESVTIEKDIDEGNSTYEKALEWLRTDEVKEALTDRNWRYLRDRWMGEQAAMERTASGTPPKEGDALMWNLVEQIRAGTPEAEVDALAGDAWKEGIISRTDWEKLLHWNKNREELEVEASGYEALVRDVIGREREAGNGQVENIDYLVTKLNQAVFDNIRSLSYAPDGTPYTEKEKEEHLRNFVTARLRGGELTQSKFLGLFNPQLSDSQFLRNAQDKALYGLVSEGDMRQAMRAIETMEPEAVDEYLYEMLFGTTSPSSLYALEENQLEVFKRMVAINRDAKDAFVEDFGEQPAQTGVTPDGIAYFSRIETVDGERVERVYRREVHDGKYEWRRYSRTSGRDTWSPYDPVAAREQEEADAARRAAWQADRAAQAQAVAAAQPDIDPEKVGTQADGTAYEAAAIDTAKGQPVENSLHHATILLLAQPMTHLADIQLPNKDRAVFDRVHRSLANPNGVISSEDFDEILKIINQHMPYWRDELEDRDRPPRTFEFTPAGATQ